MSDICLGRIVKAFGIRGELKFHPSEDFWEDALKSQRLTLISGTTPKRRPVRFRRMRPHGRSYVVAVDGICDRNQAEAMVGCEVFIDEQLIDVAMPAEALPYQLVGMKVETEQGDVLGTLSSVMHSAAHDVYEVRTDTGEFLVPAVPEFIVSVDVEDRTMVVRPIPGLIDEQ